MMNDFFAFNMFEAIVRFNDDVAKKYAGELKSAGLVVQTQTFQSLVSSFKDCIRGEDWDNWCTWINQSLLDFDESFAIPYDDNVREPVLFLPRCLISRRPAALQARMAKLRDEANDLFRNRLDDVKRFEDATRFFKDVDAIADIASAEISIVVSNRSVA
jgi:hypothetical protein